MLPTLALTYTNRVPPDAFDEFRRLVDIDGLGLQIEERSEGGRYAGLEWLIPTAVVVFIGKAYFDGFLKEMGKDHYATLKSGLKSLYARLLGQSASEVRVVSSKEKGMANQPYSLLYSLVAEGDDGIRFKLLLKRAATEEEYESTIVSFLAFLDAYHTGMLHVEVVAELQKARVIGRTLLLAYDPELNRVRPIDPIENKAAHGA